MKKFLYISFLFISVLLVSCSKQDIVPFADDTREVPAWSIEKSGSGDDTIINSTDDGGEPSDDDGNEIVDPRFDPDGKGK